MIEGSGSGYGSGFVPLTNGSGSGSVRPKNIRIRRIRIHHTDKKENKIFLIYKKIQMGSGSKSYIRKRVLIYEEMPKVFPIYEEAISHI
jgi:hypothetical protein